MAEQAVIRRAVADMMECAGEPSDRGRRDRADAAMRIGGRSSRARRAGGSSSRRAIAWREWDNVVPYADNEKGPDMALTSVPDSAQASIALSAREKVMHDSADSRSRLLSQEHAAYASASAGSQNRCEAGMQGLLKQHVVEKPISAADRWHRGTMMVTASRRIEQPLKMKRRQHRNSTAFELRELAERFASELASEVDSDEEAQQKWFQQKCGKLSGHGIQSLEWLGSKIPILDPDGWKRRAWELLIFVLVIFSAVMVPLELGFSITQSRASLVFEIFVDIIFIVDILLNFRTAYTNSDGHMVIEPGKIAWNYVLGWFLVDCLSSLPMALVILIQGDEPGTHLTALSVLKALRLLRLSRLLRFFERNASVIMRNANMISIARLLGGMCLLAHWSSCLWHFLSLRFPGYAWAFDALGDGDQSLKLTAYTWAYWNSVSIMVGGSIVPVNDIEAWLCTANLIVGACFMAVVVGNMAMLVSNMNATSHRISSHKDRVGDTARYLGVPPEIQKRIHEYFDYMAGLSHPGPEMMDLISLLPPGLYNDICDSVISKVVRALQPFCDCEEVAVLKMVQCGSSILSMPGEIIFHEGDIGQEVFFIFRGKVAFTIEEDMTGMLEEGNWFGQEALLKEATRQENAMSVTPVDLLVLCCDDVLEVMQRFPASYHILKEWDRGQEM